MSFSALDFPSHLLQIDKADLETKLVSRIMNVGGSETVNKTLNVEQAEGTRDALAKAIYHRLFDYLVKVEIFLFCFCLFSGNFAGFINL